jgi:hypothetical protein
LIGVGQAVLLIEELQAQQVVAARSAARCDSDDAFAVRRHIGAELPFPISQLPPAEVLVQVKEVIEVLHGHFNGAGRPQRLLFDVNG